MIVPSSWFAAMGAATTAAMYTPTPSPAAAVEPAPEVPVVEPGHIAAVPVSDPDLGQPHTPADPVRKPWEATKTTLARAKEALDAITLCGRLYPEAVAKPIIRDLEWMKAAGWHGDQGRLQALIDGIKLDAALRGVDVPEQPGAAA